jgi:aldehyde dehydrogenase (NAD+)
MNTESKVHELLNELGVKISDFKGKDLPVYSPIDGSKIAELAFDTESDLDQKVEAAQQAFKIWRRVPAPKRGELVRIFGNILRNNKEELVQLVTIECGKIIEEGRGEVQEMIDICDFAVGLSRQLYGLTIASERPDHVMSENWHPLGVVGVISAFNFPVAVWSWNACLAFVCGDPVIWKPSEKTPLTALAVQSLFYQACQEFGDAPEGLSSMVIGGREIGEKLVYDRRIPLISATGSTRMGAQVGPRVAARFGKSLLELGGNNAIIVTENADLKLALPSILFGAVGTAGQRCTSSRRVFVHKNKADELFNSLKTAYTGLKDKIGNPLDGKTLIGPLIDQASYDNMQVTLDSAKAQGGEVFQGERHTVTGLEEAFYVNPALVRMPKQTEIVCTETFAPILYVMTYESLEEVLVWHNSVPQGLSSTIFTSDLREAEYFRQHSDCGIANVNIGTSGAEIGGAFGGEKETGGGRESGSDAWKNYMRRQTSTVFYGKEAPALAQGIRFDI